MYKPEGFTSNQCSPTISTPAASAALRTSSLRPESMSWTDSARVNGAISTPSHPIDAAYSNNPLDLPAFEELIADRKLHSRYLLAFARYFRPKTAAVNSYCNLSLPAPQTGETLLPSNAANVSAGSDNRSVRASKNCKPSICDADGNHIGRGLT